MHDRYKYAERFHKHLLAWNGGQFEQHFTPLKLKNHALDRLTRPRLRGMSPRGCSMTDIELDYGRFYHIIDWIACTKALRPISTANLFSHHWITHKPY